MKLVKYFHFIDEKIDSINDINTLNGFHLAISGLILAISVYEMQHLDKITDLMFKIESRMNLILQQAVIEREIDKKNISDLEKELNELK